MKALTRRTDAAWLGGVCAALAARLGWSTMGVRVAVVLALLVWPLITVAAYLLATWVLRQQGSDPGAQDEHAEPTEPAEVDEWDRRLADFDRRLRH